MSTFMLNEDISVEHIIGVVFNNWTALKLAVEHGMGGSSEVMHIKISDLIQNVHECLRKCGIPKNISDLNWTTISDIIEDVMDVGFDVVLEDGSADEISKHICQLYYDWNKSIDGQKKVIDELKSLPVTTPIQVAPVIPKREKRVMMCSAFTEESDSSNSDSDPEGGWTVVKHK